MAEIPTQDSTQTETIEQMDIDTAVAEVKETIEILDKGNISLSQAKELRDRSNRLLDHIESELEVGDGEINRIEQS